MLVSIKIHWDRFWKYRFLLKELVRKNVRLQYRDSVLGMLWTMLQPLLFSLVLSLVFSSLFNRSSVNGIPYVLYLMSGRVMFSFFSDGTQSAMRSVRGNAGILKKVYVPKYIYPLSNVLSSFVNFFFSMLVLFILIAFYDIKDGYTFGLHTRILFIVVPIFILLVLSMGVGMLLSSISVFFKDTNFIYSVFCNLLMYLTPLFYSATDLKLKKGSEISAFQANAISYILRGNPLYGIVTMFRNAIFCSPGLKDNLFTGTPFYYSHWQLFYTAGVALFFFVLGALVFYKQQDKFILHL
ncbi:MAG: ABC transporter permease [Clostridium sp.]|jgi:ABC-2 type transport system permease protein|nr:ABC transporter permease [Clostridium sp.]